jgi:hypothetical protein
MNIHQLNVQYDERHDRLLVRIKTVQEQEIRLWLTRRIGVKLVEPLQTTVARIESLDPSVTLADEESRKILVHLKQEDFLKKADLQTPYAEENSELPMGALPMLVTEVTIHVHANGMTQLVIKDAGDELQAPRSCTLNMQSFMVHGLLHLLQQAVHRSQWLEPIDPPDIDDGTSDSASIRRSQKKVYTH